MSHLVLVLRKEIERVCSKNMTKIVADFHKLSASRDAEMLKLKKQVDALEREVSRLRQQDSRTITADIATENKVEAEGEQRRFSPKGLRTHRRRLRLSAGQMALLLGVSMQTIYAWEQGRVRPRPRQLPALLALRTMGVHEAQAKLAELGSE